ncbi:MAG: RAMP superfamily CRISPR-associated protein [Armatimonadota bacterium]|nr:RAMP superfamily CRISPR-associated protein [Armatimonadota bacterium]
MPDTARSFQVSRYVGLALDPIHVGTGGSRLGRVDLTIVRDPVTRVPKIPGSSLAGVLRAYAAMAQQDKHPNRQVNGKQKPYYPDCAGQGQPKQDGTGGHCGQPDCPICTVFGFARGDAGGFAGLAAFSDAHVLLFPVATREGPVWVTCPDSLRDIIGQPVEADGEAIYREVDGSPLNLGWLMLPVKKLGVWDSITQALKARGVTEEITRALAVVSDKLFSHVVNSNLEVRTSVSIDPGTGAAEERALFTYEAIPRGTVLSWTVTCRDPKHFRIGNQAVTAVRSPEEVHGVVRRASTYLEHLGIGGMGTRGMGRLRVLQGGAQHIGEAL